MMKPLFMTPTFHKVMDEAAYDALFDNDDSYGAPF